MNGTTLQPAPPPATASPGPAPRPAAPAGLADRLQTLARERAGAALAALRDPLLRNGHTLTLSGVITGVMGLVYWSIAARRYSATDVGEGSAAVSALMLIAGIAQFNLLSMLMRFVPTQGARGRKLVLAAYAVSLVTAAGLATLFVLFAGRISPGLAFFSSSWLLEAAFVLATTAGALAVLQDAALTALRRPGWVVVERGAMAVSKILLVVLLAAALPQSGIVVSWAGAIVLGVVVANVYLFRGPLRRGSTTRPTERIDTRDLVRYVAPDYAGELVWLAATSGLPLVVAAKIGATDFAYFGIAWTVTFMLGAAANNLGYSLLVEGATRPEAVAELWIRVVRHVAPLLAGAVVVLVVAAPWLLLPFGPAYSAHGTGVFRLLALAILPGLVTSTVVSAARAQRKTGLGFAVLATLSVLVIGGSVLLLPALGANAVGWAWLVGQTVVAGGALVFRRAWLPGFTFDLRRNDGVGRSTGSSHAHAPRPPATPTTTDGDLLTLPPLPAVLAALPPAPGATTQLGAPRYATLARSLGLLSAELRLGDQSVAVVKQALDEQGATALAREHAALTQLATTSRDAAILRLVPQVRWVDAEPGRATVQRWLPGVDGARLAAAQPGLLSLLLATTLDNLARLHNAVGEPAVITEDLLERWLGSRFAALAGVASVPGARRRRAQIAALRDLLSDRLLGAHTVVGVTHSDLWLGQLRFTEHGALTGIVNWTKSRTGDPLSVDACTLGLTTWAAATGRSIGEVTARALRVGGWTTLVTGHLGLPRRPREVHDDLTEPTVVVLSWLAHVCANLERSPRFRVNPLWLHQNVDRVLSELVRRPAPQRFGGLPTSGSTGRRPVPAPTRRAPATPALTASRHSARGFAPTGS